MGSKTEAIIDELSKLHPKGFDLSLGRITSLLGKLGDPHKKIPPAIHVAGTNGKGSTLAFTRAILEASGYKVHVHTSPHLVSWQERYRLAGTFVDDETLAECIDRVRRANDGQAITIFEIMSAVMFVLFSEHEADFSLIEVGLGGRFDATNVIEAPIATAITPVAMDHQAYLGDTLEKIAFEKAGIIKPKTPLAIGRQQDEARDTIEEVAQKKSAPVMIQGQDFDCYIDETGLVFQDGDGLMTLPLPSLLGEHQIDNAGLAIATIRSSGIAVTDNAYAKGMEQAVWPARMQRLKSGALVDALTPSAEIWLDGGHNPAAGNAIADALSKFPEIGSRDLVMICGMITTKEPEGYFKAFAKFSPELIAVPVANSDASFDPADLCSSASNVGIKGSQAESLAHVIQLAKDRLAAMNNPIVLFCGSLYLAGEVLELNGTLPE